MSRRLLVARLRADLLLPDAAAARGVPDLAQLGALHAVPAARPQSWQWYERYLDDPQWIDATWRSLYIGGATAVLALALGVPLAFSLVRGRFPGRVLVDRLALAPHHRADHHPLGRASTACSPS